MYRIIICVVSLYVSCKILSDVGLYSETNLKPFVYPRQTGQLKQPGRNAWLVNWGDLQPHSRTHTNRHIQVHIRGDIYSHTRTGKYLNATTERHGYTHIHTHYPHAHSTLLNAHSYLSVYLSISLSIYSIYLSNYFFLS